MATHKIGKTHSEQLASAEALDDVMYVVPSKNWLALLTVCVLLAGVVTWGVTGKVETKVSGQGMLIKSGALVDVVSASPGQLLDLQVDVGQFVRRDTVVARLAQPEVENQLRESQSLLKELEEQHVFIEEYFTKNVNLEFKYIDKKRETLQESIKLGTQRAKDLEGEVAAYEDLFKKGLITRLELETGKNKYRNAQIQLLRDKQELANLDISQHQASSQLEEQLIDLKKRIVPIREHVVSLQKRLEQVSYVKSLHSGVIIEVHRNKGDMLQEGQSVATIELSPWELQEGVVDDHPVLVAFIPPFRGVELKPGMVLNVVPEMVQEDEYGAMLGTITSVSRYPVSPKGMMRVLNNQELVEKLTQQGAPIMITATLQLDSGSPSGYAWTSGDGPPLRIYSGAQCLVKIIAREQSPVDMVIPNAQRQLLSEAAEFCSH